MGRKSDINSGAMAAVGVVALIVGIGSGSIWGFVAVCVILGGLLAAIGVIR